MRRCPIVRPILRHDLVYPTGLRPLRAVIEPLSRELTLCPIGCHHKSLWFCINRACRYRKPCENITCGKKYYRRQKRTKYCRDCCKELRKEANRSSYDNWWSRLSPINKDAYRSKQATNQFSRRRELRDEPIHVRQLRELAKLDTESPEGLE